MLVFWHRRDLRITDNLGLNYAQEQSELIVGCFCFDPNILQRQDMAPIRVQYLLGCLQELQENYRRLNRPFLIVEGDPVKVIPELAKHLQATAVVWNRDVEPYSRRRDQQVLEALTSQGIAGWSFWDQGLVAPDTILTKAGNPYTIYTPFWKNWQGQSKLNPVPPLKPGNRLSKEQEQALETVAVIGLPTLPDLGYGSPQNLIIQPGEKAAEQQLEWFSDRALETYAEQRNFPYQEGTSRLSAALKIGAIGIRTIWEKTIKIMGRSRCDETHQNIQTWQQELAWREFYQHVLYHFPQLAQGSYREHFQHFPWQNNPQHFQAWCTGKTGYPIVDAAMRQLNDTGWMHNRCRMIVASFLTKDLIINWQWGEQYFMQHLIDGDLAANNGGWQWSASSGMDAQPLRIFNPASQAQKFDPEAEYIRQWLPELKSLETEYLVTGNIPSLLREACGYPFPIVNHHQQQREFKRLYEQVKKNTE